MIVHGINPINEALNSKNLPETIYVLRNKENPRIRAIVKRCEYLNIPVEKVNDMNNLCKRNAVHQGVAGLFPGEDYLASWKDLSELPEDANKLIIFDGINDPHNFGAACRVCDVFGYDQIISHEGDSSDLTAVAIKSSSGAIFHLNLYKCNLNKAVKTLKEKGYELFALDAQGEIDIHNVELPEKYIIIIGNEGEGVRHNIKRESTLLSIPMKGHIDSLNVSCALSSTLCVLSK